MNKRRKILLFIVIGSLLMSTSAVYYCNVVIHDNAKGKLYSNVADVPFNKVGLLLGTSKYLPNGYRNPFFYYRIQAAVSLLKAGKIKYIIVSGDNSRKDYNEPAQMREDLIAQGIDSSLIYLDYAGFRTFDSIIRLKDIFGQDSVTIISQAFHNERALYIASREGIYAIGFNAKDISGSAGFNTQLREKFARVKVFLDYMFGKKPRFLGKRVIIPA